MPSTTGSLSQVWAEVRPKPAATVDERMTASVVRSLRTLPSTRWEMNGSTIAISRRSARLLTALGAGLERGRRRRDRQGRCAATSFRPGSRLVDCLGVVASEPVIDLEAGAGETTAIHRPDDDLVLEGAEQQQILDDVGRPEDAVDARALERDTKSAEQAPSGRPSPRRRAPARKGPRAEWSAATSINRPLSPTSESAGLVQPRPAPRSLRVRGPGCQRARRVGRRSLARSLE